MKPRNFVNLNVNPCKMCMPMGGSIAFKGIEGCIVMMHGSQGCSTYMRRHMATHYNEPIDIASSSLNEKGTIHGGASNLKKGLKNLIKMYNPKMVGIVTTCLAETIGEDIYGITQEFKQEENVSDIEFVPVSTPGYGGSQYEGYYVALKRIVELLAKDTTPNGKINIVVGNVTPGDVRELKSLLNAFDVAYTLLPDISNTLDAPYAKEYKRLPEGGTTLEEIRNMAGAVATIEMGVMVSAEASPGKYLEKEYGIPYYACPLPIGLENTDQFMQLLSKVSGKEIPLFIQQERGRMLDGMIDSHKYNAEGRAAIFGDPETVYAVTKTCLENGIFPALVATGSNVPKLKELLYKDFGDYMQKGLVIEDTDFDTIMKHVKELDVNIAIGNSDGRCITERCGVPLVRIGFPIHDRVGAQRKVFIGYKGSMSFVDDITNTLLENKHDGYRQEMYDKYFDGSRGEETV